MVQLLITCPICSASDMQNMNNQKAYCSNCHFQLEISTSYDDLKTYIDDCYEDHSKNCKKKPIFRKQLERYLIMYCTCGYYDVLGFIP